MPPLTPDQVKARQSFIGGSDAAAVCGVNPFKTAYQVFQEKIGEAKPLVETEAMYWGTIHESAILSRYSQTTGRTLEHQDTIQSRHYLFMGCHNDALQRDLSTQRTGVVEVKTTSRALKVGECPEPYVIQLYHNLIVSELTWGTVVILIQGNKMVYYDFHLTDPIKEKIIAIESRFWKAVQAKDWSLFGVE